MNRKIQLTRSEIDAIDNEILLLLNNRMKKALELSGMKKKAGVFIYKPEREKQILWRLEKLNRGPLSKAALRNVFYEILSASRSLQKNLTIAYLGPESTFTHQAAVRNFGKYSGYIPCISTRDVFSLVEKGSADYGVVPIENSTGGVVNHTLDMFLESDLKIASEIVLEISQFLLSAEENISRIKRIYSHPSAFPQCRQWLAENLPRAELRECASTSLAAQKAFRDKGSAAIASELAAKTYGLNILAKNIEDSKKNYTRFLVLGKNLSEASGRDKTSIMFGVKDRIGVLHDMLVPFKKNRINLTKIESRPSKRKPWEYFFFVDFMGHQEDPKVSHALKALERHCTELKILGSYPVSHA